MEKYLSFDIETTLETYNESALICIGFFNGAEAICIPWLKQGGDFYWKPEERPRVIQAIHKLLSGSSKKILQNCMFDCQVLHSFGFVTNNLWIDSMLAHHLLYVELPHDLAFIASTHTDIPYYKDEVKADTTFIKLPDKTLRTYNLLDCIATYLASFDMLPILTKRGL